MLLIILRAALAVVATFIEVRRDGFRPVATDWSRVAVHDLAGSSAHGRSYR
jgi:hypothetical protein